MDNNCPTCRGRVVYVTGLRQCAQDFAGISRRMRVSAILALAEPSTVGSLTD